MTYPRIVIIDFEPSRVRSGKVVRVGWSWSVEDPTEASLLAFALQAFIDGAVECPFVQRQARRGRDSFPSRDPKDYRLREIAPDHFTMEPRER